MRPSASKASQLAVQPPWCKTSELSTFAYLSFDGKPLTLAGGIRFVQALRRLSPARQAIEVCRTMIKLSTSDQFKLCGAIGIVGSSAKNLKYIVWLLGQLEGKFTQPERAAYADIDEIKVVDPPLPLEKLQEATEVMQRAVQAGGKTGRARRRGKQGENGGSDEDSDDSEDDLPVEPAAKRRRTERTLVLPPSPLATPKARFALKPRPKQKRQQGRSGGDKGGNCSTDVSTVMGSASNSGPDRRAMQPLSNQAVNARMVSSL